VLTDAQVKLLGPLQPAGSAAPPVTPNPVIAFPSLEVNVILTVCAAPTATDTTPATEEVATTKSLLPVGWGVPEIGSAGGLLVPPLLLPVPLATLLVPLLLP
jgi:hypothetical protein